MTIPAGILLPQSTLTQPWFLVFALVVGFNTLIYLGLTISKLIPWPPQIHPSRVRAIMPTMTAKELTVNKGFKAQMDTSEDPFTRLRHDAARQTIPQAMVLVGAVMLVIALLNLLINDNRSTLQSIGGMITAFVLIASSQVLVRGRVTAPTMIILWSAFTVAIIAELSFYAQDRNEPVVLVYAVVLLIMLAPTSMSMRAGIFGGALAGTAVLLSGWRIDSLLIIPWTLASGAAIAAGLVLLQLRLTIIDRLAMEQVRANALASTDPLTGVFSRVGLLSLAETIASSASSGSQPVHVAMCDIRDLHSINVDYGMDFGDEVIRVTARAMRASLPPTDLLARWDGDSFLALGSSAPAELGDLAQSLEEAIARSSIALGKRAIRVSVGTAVGDPRDLTFEELVAMAIPSSANPAEPAHEEPAVSDSRLD